MRDDNDDSAAHFTPNQKLRLLLKVWLSWICGWKWPLQRSQTSRSCEQHARWHKSMCCAFRASDTAYASTRLSSRLSRLHYSSGRTGVISVPHIQTKGAQGEECTPLAHRTGRSSDATKGLTKRPSAKRSISTWRHCVTAFVACPDRGISRPSSII